MPSMPMFTTPARSDHRPDKPARAIGMAAVMAASTAPDEVRLLAFEISLMAEITAIPTATISNQAQAGSRRETLVAGRSTGVAVVMPPPALGSGPPAYERRPSAPAPAGSGGPVRTR